MHLFLSTFPLATPLQCHQIVEYDHFDDDSDHQEGDLGLFVDDKISFGGVNAYEGDFFGYVQIGNEVILI